MAKPRARTQAGRNSCSSAANVETAAIQASPASTNVIKAAGSPGITTMAADAAALANGAFADEPGLTGDQDLAAGYGSNGEALAAAVWLIVNAVVVLNGGDSKTFQILL